MKILVGSIFSHHERSSDWYNLQINFLKKTTNFVHVVHSNNCNIDFHSSTVVSKGENKDTWGSVNHVYGLNKLLDYFKTQDYEYYLILDCDCFPIVSWVDKLLEKMNGFEIASIVRTENLDLFAHPSMTFFKKSALDYLKFDIFKNANLLGNVTADTSINAKFFPLLRTNKVNLHPILCGIYFNLFYHHGGSVAAITAAYHGQASRYYSYDKNDEQIISDNSLDKLLSKNCLNFLDMLCGKSNKIFV